MHARLAGFSACRAVRAGLSRLLILLVTVAAVSPSPGYGGGPGKDEVVLLGPLTGEELLAISPAWKRIFRDYRPGGREMAALKAAVAGRAGLEVVGVVGTWCSDSRVLIPKFLKIQELLGEARLAISFEGVDRSLKEPASAVEGRRIEKVPTLIVYEKGRELGRIAESPAVTVEADLRVILDAP